MPAEVESVHPSGTDDVPEPTDGPGDGVVMAFCLPGSDGEAFVDVLSLLTDAPRLDDPEPAGPAGGGTLSLAVVPWEADLGVSVTDLTARHARVRALTLGPLDLRAGAAVHHAAEVGGLGQRAAARGGDGGPMDWERLARLHCHAHRARVAWYELVDHAGIATVDVFTEHWHDAPLEVASLVARWLGLDMTVPVDDGVLALLTGGRSSQETALCAAARDRIQCEECDASAASARRLTWLETWALNGAIGKGG